MKSIFTVVAVSVLISACTKPLDTIIPPESKWESDLKPVIAKLSDEDKKYLGSHLVRAKAKELFSGQTMTQNLTIQQAINDQKNFIAEQERVQAEQQALKEKTQREIAERQKQFDAAITVSVIGKKILQSDFMQKIYQDQQLIKLAIQNKSNKTITGIQGYIHFINIFGDDVGIYGIEFTTPIESQKTANFVVGRDYNQFLKDHVAINNLEEGKYTTQFSGLNIIYADGSKLSNPDAK